MVATGNDAMDPVVSATGKLPFRLWEPMCNKLDQVTADGIIVPVPEPTDWVSRRLVVSKPDGDVKLVKNPSNLNKAILRQHFAVLTVEQLFA